MNKYFYPIAFLVILFLASNARAQSLWNGTEHGMTTEQVKAVVPNLIHPPKPSHLYDGSEELLRLEGITLVNQHFSASFYFKAGKLNQVTLSLEKGHSFHSAMLVFDSIKQALRAKYGPEINHKVQKGILNQATATWLSGRTNINLYAMSVGENDAVLNINYQVRISTEADKL